MQDSFAMFDTQATGLLSAAGQFNGGLAAAYTSTKSYDTAVAGVPAAVGPSGGTIGGPLLHDLGRGIRLRFDARIHVAVTSAGAATVAVDFICADDLTLTTNQTNLLQSGAIAKAALVVGYRYRHASVPGVVPRRFVGALVTIGTATVTAGTYSSGLMLDQEDHADVLG